MTALLTSAGFLLALVIGIACGWTAARRKFGQSDLEPSEFSTFWQERA